MPETDLQAPPAATAVDTAIKIVYGVMLAAEVVLVVDYLTDGNVARWLSAESHKLAVKATKPISVYREWRAHRHEPVFEAMQTLDEAQTGE
jgi:hypothetical protein